MSRPQALYRLSLLALLWLNLAPGTTPALAAPVQSFGFEVVQKVPHPRENFVQGLQIVGDTLYVGTGQYGESRLREYAFPAMKLRRDVALPEALFGEGVTRLGERLYQLTWRAGLMFIYNADSLALERTHRIATQGWGITHNGSELIYSDGSDRLYLLDPEDLALRRTIEVRLNGQPLPRLNELEWIDGEVWANVWGANQLVRIDPATGDVVGIVDLTGLLDPNDRAADTDVLNGIAWDADRRALWVTGKRWPWLYEVRLIALPAATR